MLAAAARFSATLALVGIPILVPAHQGFAQGTSTDPSGQVRSVLRRTGEERDRVELGVAIPEGGFDFLGTLAYRRFLREGGPFEQTLQLELTGGRQDHITEGAISAYYFLRPLNSYRQAWRLRPLLEVGPGAHLVVQSADIEGFEDTSFHTRSFLKTHLYAGAELLLTNKVGFLVRARLTAPEHHPLDYAQAAIFLR